MLNDGTMWSCNLAWGYAITLVIHFHFIPYRHTPVTLVTHVVDMTPKKQGMSCVQSGRFKNRTKQQAHQAGFTDDADKDAAG